jgi:hypothetical protein
MEVISFERESRAREAKRKKDAMSSRLLLLRLRKHHYEYAPDNLKYLPSPIVGDPVVNQLITLFNSMPAPGAFELRKVKSSVKVIMGLTARYYKVAIDDILGPRRDKKIVRARKVAQYLAHEHTMEPAAQLSRKFCRDHSTLHYARQDIAQRLLTDKILALQVQTIRRQLEASWECPEIEQVRQYRKNLKMTNQRWDVQSEVLLIQGVAAGKQWQQIGKELGVSAAAACNKWLRLDAAKKAFEAAGV